MRKADILQFPPRYSVPARGTTQLLPFWLRPWFNATIITAYIAAAAFASVLALLQGETR
jgi:hypothetical protein